MSGCSHCAGDRAARPGGGDPRFRRVLWIALAANGLMFVVEIVASLMAGSVALQADALDFLGDAGNYGLSLMVLGMNVQTRAGVALAKGVVMGAFGLGVLAVAVWRLVSGTVPDAALMGGTALLALGVNVGVAALLFSHRFGDSNQRSVWLCSRNDAIANMAVMLAAAGVFATAAGWPDVVVAAVIAALGLSAAREVILLALAEMRGAPAVAGRRAGG